MRLQHISSTEIGGNVGKLNLKSYCEDEVERAFVIKLKLWKGIRSNSADYLLVPFSFR